MKKRMGFAGVGTLVVATVVATVVARQVAMKTMIKRKGREDAAPPPWNKQGADVR